MNPGPHWVRNEGSPELAMDRKAHLIKSGYTGRDDRTWKETEAWCGLTLPPGMVSAPVAPRCTTCTTTAKAYFDKALVPPPEIVAESVVLVVRRPYEDVSLRSWLERHTANKKTWEFVIEDLPEEVQ